MKSGGEAVARAEGRQTQKRWHRTGLVPVSAGETAVLLWAGKGRPPVGTPGKNLQEKHNSNSKIYVVVTLLVLPVLDVQPAPASPGCPPLDNVHGVCQTHALGFAGIQRDVL